MRKIKNINKMNRLYVFLIFVLSSCATDYGRKPIQVEGLSNVYEFTVYYSTPIDRQEIRAYADNIAQKLMLEKGCSSYELRNLGNKLPGDRYYKYRAILKC